MAYARLQQYLARVQADIDLSEPSQLLAAINVQVEDGELDPTPELIELIEAVQIEEGFSNKKLPLKKR